MKNCNGSQTLNRSNCILIAFAFCFIGLSLSLKDEAQILLANSADIRLIALDNPNKSEIIANKLDRATACDYVFQENLFFWIDNGKIQCTNLSDPNRKKRTIIESVIEQPDGLACDWISKKLYWSDSKSKRIKVSELDGSSRKVLIWGNLDQPRAIAVDPHSAYMYWTDWGEIPKIERAGMDGSKRKTLVEKNIYWPNGITLDYDEKKVYWVEANYHAIYRMNMDGSQRQVVINDDEIRLNVMPAVPLLTSLFPSTTAAPPFQNENYRGFVEDPKLFGALQHPYAISLFEDRIYWTDWATFSLQSLLKNGSGLPRIIKKDNISPMDLQVYHRKRQKPGSNPCVDNNSGCSHLCLLSPDPPYFKCACPTGVKLKLDRKTCQNGPREFLLVARRSDLRMISLDTSDYSDVVIASASVQHAVAITFDPVDRFVYWTDDDLQAIFRARLNGSDSQAVITEGVEKANGVAVDWIARNFYWTDGGRNYISVSRLNGTMKKILIETEIDEPRAITLDPVGGRMYWSDWGVKSKIEQANLDGTNRLVLVQDDIAWPNGLAVDPSKQRLFWADARMDRIEMISLNGTNRRILLSDRLPHVFDLSFLGDYLYWSDSQTRRIERMIFNRRQTRETIKQFPDILGLHAASLTPSMGSNPCARNNGGCSHLCLYTPQGVRCHCPTGWELAPSLADCFIPEAFLLMSFTSTGGIRKLPLDSARANTQIPFERRVDASFMDFSVKDNQIYWTDTKKMVIMRSLLNGTNVEVFLEIGIQILEGIAVDWIGRNLYWADSSHNRIEAINIDNFSRRLIVFKDIESPRCLALDPQHGHIYWSEWGSIPRIKRANMDGSNIVQINKATIGRANSLTIDHAAQKLYWVDYEINMIVFSDLNGNYMSDVVRGGISKSISSLSLYGEYVYWSDSKRRAIMRANKMTGAVEETVKSDLNDVDDIVIYHSSRQTGVTSCSHGNGGCEHLCLSLPEGKHTCACPTHYSLNKDNRTCTALQWKANDLRSIPDDKESLPNGKAVKSLEESCGIEKSEQIPFTFLVAVGLEYVLEQERGMNVCGGCETEVTEQFGWDGKESRNYKFIEVVKFRNWTFTLEQPDGCAATIFAPSNFLLLSQTTYITRVIFRIPGTDVAVVPGRGRNNFRSRRADSKPAPDGVLSITGMENACAIDYDPPTDTLFWIDCKEAIIKSSKPDGTKTRVLFRNNVTNYRPYDIAVDVYSRFLYWTDLTTNSIRLMTSNGEMIGVVLMGKVKNSGKKDIDIRPRKIVVDPLRGRIYFSNACDNPRVCRETIMQAALDGSDCIVFFGGNLKNITALTVDVGMERLYWADQSKIESSNLDGSNRVILVETSLFMPVGLAVFGEDLYWIDARVDGGLLEGASKIDGSRRRKIQTRMRNLSDLVSVVATGNNLMNHPCSVDNGACSHICVVKDDMTTRCSCPNHLVLNGLFQCVVPSTCASNQFTCKRPHHCIPLDWVCDKNPECEDASDEENCPVEKVPNPIHCSGRFSCGLENLESLHPFLESVPQCIEFSDVCNGIRNCLNGKDESDCNFCDSGQIRCSGRCVAASTCGQCKNDICTSSVPTPQHSYKQSLVIGLSVAVFILILVAFLLWKYCVCRNKGPYPTSVVTFTSNEHGLVNVEFQTHDNPSNVRSSLMGRRRKPPFLVSIMPPPSANGSQGSTTASVWPNHRNGELAERPRLSGTSCNSTLKHPLNGFLPSSEDYLGDCCSSSDSNSFHDSCSRCRRQHHHRRYRKISGHGPPPPTPCTTDTCDDFERRAFRSVDTSGLPHEPPPPYSQHYNCCHQCYHQLNRCHASSSLTSSRRHGSNGRPPSYERLRTASRRRHYHRRLGGLTSDSDPCPPPPTPRSQYLSEFDTTEAEVETMTTRIEESEPEDEENETLLNPSRRSSPSATEMSYFAPYNPPPSPVSS